MKSHEYGIEYASARATPELVGRKEILGIIKKAIESKNRKPQVVYITAKGGMGKTRLLEEVVKFWNKQSRLQKKTNILVVSHLVDLYHTHTHNKDGLIDEIVDALDKKHFKKYFEKRAAFIHKKYEMGESPDDLRQEMIDAFVGELNELARKYNKVVLVFDTAEVLHFQMDPSQKALGPAQHLTDIAFWLTQELISRLRNVTVLIAGRPPKSSDHFLEELNKTGTKVTSYTLPGFQAEETLSYFNVMARVTRKENPQSAERIQSIPEETQRVIHDLTQGEPFVLALLIDYLAITEELPSLETRDPKGFREDLGNRVIEAIQKCLRPSDEVVEALSWAPKGMGAQLLAWVLKHRQPNELEIEEAGKAIDELRKPKKRLSFVKIRTDNLVFLQDEMYSLMKEVHHSEGMKVQKGKVDRDIHNFYEWKIDETRKKIQERELELDAIRHTPEKLPHLSPVSVIREEEILSKAHAHLQAYQVEHVYYTLRVNPPEGFRLFLKYAEEAFQNREDNLWQLLKDELLRFYKYLPVEGLSQIDIEAYMGIILIRTRLGEDRINEAERVINRIRDTSGGNLLKPGSYLDLELKIWETWVLVYTGRDPKDARYILNEILRDLEKLLLLPEISLVKWRLNFLKASALYWHGYLSWSQGEFKDAVQWYLQALPLWRELKIEVQQATTLNDLSWAEAETGAFETALSHCKDGLKLRRQLGKPYLIALSLNTMGLIEIRYGKPETARFHCEQALEIFRRQEDARGIGLACLALAESLRRTTNTDLFVYDEKMKIDYLTRAAERATEAVMIFKEKVKDEPLRLVEAYIELGCVYREWIRQLHKDDPMRRDKIKRSHAAYEMAVKVARKSDYEYRAIDALVNMAWLYYYAGNFSEARGILEKKVRNQIGDEYLYTKDHGAERTTPNPWHWVQLGKANVLLGMMFFDEYREAHAKDSQLAEKRLRQAAHNWALSMAYNTLYGNNFRDFNKGREDVYSRLAELNIQEMKWVKDSMEQTHREYHIPGEGMALEQLLKERFQI
ncbi:MAG: tetratricopeptide repeat protein [Chloroflexota bacterium]